MSRGVSVRSVIGLCVFGSTMLYASTIAVRSSGTTEYIGDVTVVSPGSGRSDETAMSTWFAKKFSRAEFDEESVTSTLKACAPVQKCEAHWYSAGAAEASDSMRKSNVCTGGQSAKLCANCNGTITRLEGKPLGLKPSNVSS